MKRKQIEQVPLKKPKRMKKDGSLQVAAQLSGKYLILDLWKNGIWASRHAMDTETGEYGSYGLGIHWAEENINNAFCDGYIYPDEDRFQIAEKDRALVLEALNVHWPCRNVYYRISSMESAYSRWRREQKEERRVRKVNELMDSVPAVGNAVYDWIEEKVAGSRQYAILRDKASGVHHCTACGGDFTEAAAGIRLRHGKAAPCPLCGHMLTVEKRRDSVRMEARLTLIHGLDEKRGIQRHFAVTVEWSLHRVVRLRETIRCMLHRGAWSRYCFEIYYAQRDGWDNKGNPGNLRWKPGYLYPGGIREGLKDTAYHGWTDVFSHMASMGIQANYDRLMCDLREDFIGMVEYLAKGRFYRLLMETSERVMYHSGYGDCNAMNPAGEDICEVMYLWDRQKISRLRQEDGGINMLEWLQWADEGKKKIGSDVLGWYGKNRISALDYGQSRAAEHLSPEQLMHYIERQQKESFAGKRNASSVFNTYEDYLSMAEKLGKDLSDPMVYRPRELKRRHDELVEAQRLQQDQEKAREAAEKMEERYPGSGTVLEEIKPVYEYEGEHFRIMVPGSFYEITMEGMALHHCVGNTERYFDRILQHETYICFLRRMEEPGKAFCTLEVEPGGTIRQHRGMCDEEPDMEEIRPFLREWQKEIRKRMKAQDHEYARISAIKREENLEELRQKGNTRVLKALMEDLMEVV
ncbi:MAG: hypothetical protein HFH84_19535 [Lachnospiraceae bacterium]|nr:hypothetical protein [Lachnospiraceae bacterium]